MKEPRPLSPLLLIWKARIDDSDGTSVQLGRMLEGLNQPVFHVQADRVSNEGRQPGLYAARRIWLEPPFDIRFGGGLMRRLWLHWGVGFAVRWNWHRFAAKLALPKPQIAYVVVLKEQEAKYAVAALAV